MSGYRYVLLCRHARHDDGELVAVKDENDVWRFPTDYVARALAEELWIGREHLRLTKIVWSPTPEASRTAQLILQRLGGAPAKSTTRKPPQQPSQELTPDQRPSVTMQPPVWLQESEPGQVKDRATDVLCEPWEELLPSRLYMTSAGALRRLKNELQALPDGGNALLLIGHQPQMGWLSCYLLQGHWRRWRSAAVPLSASEVVCLRLQMPQNEQSHTKKADAKWRGRLLWSLVPDDRDALNAVTEKVRGKMESAKLLSAVITLVLTALLGVLLDESRWAGLAKAHASLLALSYNGQTATRCAFTILLGALALYLLTMYAYDRLLMPPRFWAEAPDRFRDSQAPDDASHSKSLSQRVTQRRKEGPWLPRRPPSSSAWVAYRNMQRIWFGLFTPANILVGLALSILAAPLLRLDDWAWAFVTLFALATTVWAWWFRPVLGSED